MQVVGHEAVRNNCKPFIISSAQNLHERRVDARPVNEVLLTVMSAKRQEIPAEIDVIERLQVSRPAGAHDWAEAMAIPVSGSA
jgi:hypothetical protein